MFGHKLRCKAKCGPLIRETQNQKFVWVLQSRPFGFFDACFILTPTFAMFLRGDVSDIEKGDWSPRFVRLRLEMTFSAALLFIFTFFGVEHGYRPFLLPINVPSSVITIVIAALAIYFIAHLIIRAIDERSKVDAFTSEIERSLHEVRRVKENMLEGVGSAPFLAPGEIEARALHDIDNTLFNAGLRADENRRNRPFDLMVEIEKLQNQLQQRRAEGVAGPDTEAVERVIQRLHSSAAELGRVANAIPDHLAQLREAMSPDGEIGKMAAQYNRDVATAVQPIDRIAKIWNRRAMAFSIERYWLGLYLPLLLSVALVLLSFVALREPTFRTLISDALVSASMDVIGSAISIPTTFDIPGCEMGQGQHPSYPAYATRLRGALVTAER